MCLKTKQSRGKVFEFNRNYFKDNLLIERLGWKRKGDPKVTFSPDYFLWLDSCYSQFYSGAELNGKTERQRMQYKAGAIPQGGLMMKKIT